MLIKQKIIFTDEDIKPYRIYKGVPIARTGVQKYLESELFPNGSDTKIINIYRPIDEVKKLVKDMHNIPIVLNHPSEDIKFDDNLEIIGVAINPRFEDNLLKADLVFYKQPKFKQLSLGYNANIRTIGGKLTVTDMSINHLAVVSRARCGNICSIDNKIKDGKKMATVIIDNQAFEVDEKVATSFELAKKTNEELKKQNKTAFEDGVKYAKEYTELTAIADKRGVKVNDGAKLYDIKKAIVESAKIKVNDGVSEEYLDGVISSLRAVEEPRSITDSFKNEFDFSKLIIGGK